jgi:hypothetical protein
MDCSGVEGPGSAGAAARLFRDCGLVGMGGSGGLLAAESAASLAEERVTLEDMRFYLLDSVESI